MSRKAQAQLLVLSTLVAGARAYAERGPGPREWCFSSVPGVRCCGVRALTRWVGPGVLALDCV
jgi:hypothetical protein